MTITKPFEVVGRICRQQGSPGRYAQITVRVEPAEQSEYVNEARGAEFEKHFAEAAFDGIRSIAERYSWLSFRFTITSAIVHPVDSGRTAFRWAGEAAAKEIFKRIYKKLTITAKHPTTEIFIDDTEGNLVQTEVGRLETKLVQGVYDIFFGNDRTSPVRIDLQEDTMFQEGQ